MKPEDLTLYYQITQECKDRIDYLNVTSYDFIAVVGCTKDNVRIPFVDKNIHKAKIGIAVVTLDILSVLFIAFIFSKLTNINNRYIKIVDNMCVQMTDFGIKMNNVKLDRYT